jgi:hypothetical protein
VLVGASSKVDEALLDKALLDEALDVCYRYIVGDHGLSAGTWLAAHALHQHAPARARQAAEILQHRIADSGVQAEKRNYNIAVLAGLGREYKPAAAALALRMALDPEAGPDGVQYAAKRLASLGSEHLQAATDELERIARDPGTPASSLLSIASTLHELHRDGAAVAAVRRAMADPALTAWNLIGAARVLGTVDRQYHEEAAAIYRRFLSDDPSVGMRTTAARSMAALGGEYKREGAAALRALAADPARTDDQLRMIAKGLARIGPEYRKEAEAMLRL